MNVDQNLEKYIENHSTKESELLKLLEKETFRKTSHPNMLSGYLQGRILSFISKLIQPKNILEIGTFTGYATLCMAEGLSENGKIITIDCNKEIEFISKKYFELSEYSSQIIYHFGNALEIIPSLEQEFDLIFLDADKENYAKYYKIIKHKLKKGGVILADNVLWYGKVAIEKNEDIQTQFLKDFNILVKNDIEMENIILPIRDGINCIRKK